MKRFQCHDCGCNEGELHDYGCDMERCPFCGRQLISCSCQTELCMDHNFVLRSWTKVEAEHRIPYIRIPVLCALCGDLYPDFFNVPDDEWKKYIIPSLQSKVLCRKCYNRQKELFPEGWEEAKEKKRKLSKKEVLNESY